MSSNIYEQAFQKMADLSQKGQEKLQRVISRTTEIDPVTAYHGAQERAREQREKDAFFTDDDLNNPFYFAANSAVGALGYVADLAENIVTLPGMARAAGIRTRVTPEQIALYDTEKNLEGLRESLRAFDAEVQQPPGGMEGWKQGQLRIEDIIDADTFRLAGETTGSRLASSRGGSVDAFETGFGAYQDDPLAQRRKELSQAYMASQRLNKPITEVTAEDIASLGQQSTEAIKQALFGDSTEPKDILYRDRGKDSLGRQLREFYDPKSGKTFEDIINTPEHNAIYESKYNKQAREYYATLPLARRQIQQAIQEEESKLEQLRGNTTLDDKTKAEISMLKRYERMLERSEASIEKTFSAHNRSNTDRFFEVIGSDYEKRKEQAKDSPIAAAGGMLSDIAAEVAKNPGEVFNLTLQSLPMAFALISPAVKLSYATEAYDDMNRNYQNKFGRQMNLKEQGFAAGMAMIATAAAVGGSALLRTPTSKLFRTIEKAGDPASKVVAALPKGVRKTLGMTAAVASTALVKPVGEGTAEVVEDLAMELGTKQGLEPVDDVALAQSFAGGFAGGVGFNIAFARGNSEKARIDNAFKTYDRTLRQNPPVSSNQDVPKFNNPIDGIRAIQDIFKSKNNKLTKDDVNEVTQILDGTVDALASTRSPNAKAIAARINSITDILGIKLDEPKQKLIKDILGVKPTKQTTSTAGTSTGTSGTGTSTTTESVSDNEKQQEDINTRYAQIKGEFTAEVGQLNSDKANLSEEEFNQRLDQIQNTYGPKFDQLAAEQDALIASMSGSKGTQTKDSGTPSVTTDEITNFNKVDPEAQQKVQNDVYGSMANNTLSAEDAQLALDSGVISEDRVEEVSDYIKVKKSAKEVKEEIIKGNPKYNNLGTNDYIQEVNRVIDQGMPEFAQPKLARLRGWRDTQASKVAAYDKALKNGDSTVTYVTSTGKTVNVGIKNAVSAKGVLDQMRKELAHISNTYNLLNKKYESAIKTSKYPPKKAPPKRAPKQQLSDRARRKRLDSIIKELASLPSKRDEAIANLEAKLSAGKITQERFNKESINIDTHFEGKRTRLTDEFNKLRKDGDITLDGSTSIPPKNESAKKRKGDLLAIKGRIKDLKDTYTKELNKLNEKLKNNEITKENYEKSVKGLKINIRNGIKEQVKLFNKIWKKGDEITLSTEEQDFNPDERREIYNGMTFIFVPKGDERLKGAIAIGDGYYKYIQEGITKEQLIEYIGESIDGNKDNNKAKAQKVVVTKYMKDKYDIDLISIINNMTSDQIQDFIKYHEYSHVDNEDSTSGAYYSNLDQTIASKYGKADKDNKYLSDSSIEIEVRANKEALIKLGLYAENESITKKYRLAQERHKELVRIKKHIKDTKESYDRVITSLTEKLNNKRITPEEFNKQKQKLDTNFKNGMNELVNLFNGTRRDGDITLDEDDQPSSNNTSGTGTSTEETLIDSHKIKHGGTNVTFELYHNNDGSYRIVEREDSSNRIRSNTIYSYDSNSIYQDNGTEKYTLRENGEFVGEEDSDDLMEILTYDGSIPVKASKEVSKKLTELGALEEWAYITRNDKDESDILDQIETIVTNETEPSYDLVDSGRNTENNTNYEVRYIDNVGYYVFELDEEEGRNTTHIYAYDEDKIYQSDIININVLNINGEFVDEDNLRVIDEVEISDEVKKELIKLFAQKELADAIGDGNKASALQEQINKIMADNKGTEIEVVKTKSGKPSTYTYTINIKGEEVNILSWRITNFNILDAFNVELQEGPVPVFIYKGEAYVIVGTNNQKRTIYNLSSGEEINIAPATSDKYAIKYLAIKLDISKKINNYNSSDIINDLSVLEGLGELIKPEDRASQKASGTSSQSTDTSSTPTEEEDFLDTSENATGAVRGTEWDAVVGEVRITESDYWFNAFGDTRFTDIYAVFEDGYTIANKWAEIKKAKNYKIVNGKPDSLATYVDLWREWAKDNTELMEELKKDSKGMRLMYYGDTGYYNSAYALATILKETASQSTDTPSNINEDTNSFVNTSMKYQGSRFTGDVFREDGVDVVRKRNITESFGNPFGVKNKDTKATVPDAGNVEEVSNYYFNWLLKNTIPESIKPSLTDKQKDSLNKQREFIIGHIASGNLKGESLIYMPLNDDTEITNHAFKLSELINSPVHQEWRKGLVSQETPKKESPKVKVGSVITYKGNKRVVYGFNPKNQPKTFLLEDGGGIQPAGKEYTVEDESYPVKEYNNQKFIVVNGRIHSTAKGSLAYKDDSAESQKARAALLNEEQPQKRATITLDGSSSNKQKTDVSSETVQEESSEAQKTSEEDLPPWDVEPPTSSQTLTESENSLPIKIEEFNGFWTREEVAAQTDKVFLFGDNTDDRLNTKYIPTSTQAVIRGLPNAIGIDTKKDRGTNATSYFTDSDFLQFKQQVDEAIKQAKSSGKTIVIPADGIGTGKAGLKERAPKLFNYLEEQLNNLKSNTSTESKGQTGTPPTKVGFTVIPKSTVPPAEKKKAPFKASKATKFIGFGIRGSSTELYAQQAKEQGIPVNSTSYTTKDVVFASVSGNASKEQITNTVNIITQALDDGALVLLDSEGYLNNSKYNKGEKEVAERLLDLGYTRVTAKGDPNVGIWSKQKKKPSESPQTPVEAPNVETDEKGNVLYIQGTVDALSDPINLGRKVGIVILNKRTGKSYQKVGHIVKDGKGNIRIKYVDDRRSVQTFRISDAKSNNVEITDVKFYPVSLRDNENVIYNSDSPVGRYIDYQHKGLLPPIEMPSEEEDGYELEDTHRATIVAEKTDQTIFQKALEAVNAVLGSTINNVNFLSEIVLPKNIEYIYLNPDLKTIPEEIGAALKLTFLKFLADDIEQYKSNSMTDISYILIGSGDSRISRVAMKELRNIGKPRNSLIDSLASDLKRFLPLKPKEGSITERQLESLYDGLALSLINYMINLEIATDEEGNSIKLAEISKVTGKALTNLGGEEFSGDATLDFIKVNNFSLSPENAMNVETMLKGLNNEKLSISPNFTPVVSRIQKFRKRTLFRITKQAIDTIKKLRKIKYYVNKEMWDVYSLFNDNDINYILDIENPKDYVVDLRDTIEGQNQQKLDSWNNLKKFISFMTVNNTIDSPIYFDWFIASNDRIHAEIQGGIDIQNDTLHRFSLNPGKDFVITDKYRHEYKVAVLAGLKLKGYETDFGKYDSEDVKLVDDMFEVALKTYGNLKLDSREQMKEFVRKNGAHGVMSLIALKKYDPTNDFKVTLMVEFDQVTSGTSNSSLLLAEDTKLLQAAGYFDEESGFSSYMDARAQDLKDNYERVMLRIKELIEGKELPLFSLIQEFAGIDINRNFAKSPSTIFNYGAGEKRISEEQGESIITEMLYKVSELVKNGDDAALNAFINEAEVRINTTLDRLIKEEEESERGVNENWLDLLKAWKDLNRKEELFNMRELQKDGIKEFRLSMVKTVLSREIGAVTAQALNEVFGDIVKSRETILNLAQYMYLLHLNEFNEDIESATFNKEDNESLSLKEMKEIFMNVDHPATVPAASSTDKSNWLQLGKLKYRRSGKNSASLKLNGIKEFNVLDYDSKTKKFVRTLGRPQDSINVNTREINFIKPGASAITTIIQSVDSHNMQRTVLEDNSQDGLIPIHDAVITSVESAKKIVTNFNKNVLATAAGTYNPVEAMVNVFEDDDVRLKLFNTLLELDNILKENYNKHNFEEVITDGIAIANRINFSNPDKLLLNGGVISSVPYPGGSFKIDDDMIKLVDVSTDTSDGMDFVEKGTVNEQLASLDDKLVDDFNKCGP